LELKARCFLATDAEDVGLEVGSVAALVVLCELGAD
jgi:hypothetical protein